jgi:NAD(P)-dependent dehydrogenase (short-subunit alcohol dehydrogenase family)
MLLDKFKIQNKVCVITGGGGLLGFQHARAILEGGGIPVLLDISAASLKRTSEKLSILYKDTIIPVYVTDITDREQLEEVVKGIFSSYGSIYALINNAANNPKMEEQSKNLGNIRFDNFPLSIWNDDIAVALTGAFLCSQVIGARMEQAGHGVILNISSDLGIIAPDQRIYKKEGLADRDQIIKPVTYSVAKHGLIGLTKYLATYWADKGIRVNTLCPAGVENGQSPEFIQKLKNLIPMGRMANVDEYQCTVLYMLSEASSYMTGATIIVDGGRTCW